MSGKTVSVSCDGCDKVFDRSVFQPYQTKCPACRGRKVKAKPIPHAVANAGVILLLSMADRGISGQLSNINSVTYVQKNGERYFRVENRKFFSRKEFVEHYNLV